MTARARDAGEDLVEDRDTLQRFGLRERERRVDAHARKVAHEQEPAPERAEKDLLADVRGERLLAAAVFHQIHADQQTLAADVADELVLLLEGHEPAEENASDPRGAFDEV